MTMLLHQKIKDIYSNNPVSSLEFTKRTIKLIKSKFR